MRHDGKARGGGIAALWRRRATHPAGMQRPPNAITISDSLHKACRLTLSGAADNFCAMQLIARHHHHTHHHGLTGRGVACLPG